MKHTLLKVEIQWFYLKYYLDIKDIEASIKEKREYKHGLLYYLVHLIDGEVFSNEFHQEIGMYLGVDKHILCIIVQYIGANVLQFVKIIRNLLFG